MHDAPVNVGSNVMYVLSGRDIPGYVLPCEGGSCMGTVLRIDTNRSESWETDYPGQYLVKWHIMCQYHAMVLDGTDAAVPDITPDEGIPGTKYYPDYPDNPFDSGLSDFNQAQADESDKLYRWAHNMPVGSHWVTTGELMPYYM